jgi:PEP-CTERM motif
MRFSLLGRRCMRIVIGSVVAIVAAADARADNLVVTNGDFAQYSGTTPGTNGDSFTNVNPTGWSGGGGLIFVTNYAGINNPNLYLPVYGPFPNSPLGGNFVEADGNPSFASGFSYQLSGLTVGKTYTLSFFQAGGQQTGFGNGLNTTEQWIVGLGTAGFSVQIGAGGADSYYGGNDSTYSLGDANGSVAVSSLMTTPSGGVTPWQQVTVSLTADASNDLLSFLAWGDTGNTVNLPPIAFLDIKGNGAAVPEPASLALIVVGMLGVGAYRLRRRRSNPTTA